MLKLSRPNISEEAIAAVADVLRSGQLVHGSECEEFERELAAYLGCEDVVLVSSGTAALHVALLALGIGPGDAVIVPDFTFPATANAVVMVGARPVMVDVDMGTYTLSVDKLETLISEWRGPDKLKAIIPVHEFGCPAPMDDIARLAEENGLYVIEDAACALGATHKGEKAGTLGHVGCFSFHPRKTLTTGEGGAVATNDRDLAARMRRLRNHGMERSEAGIRFYEPALNYRLTNFQAALGRRQLPFLDDWIRTREQLARSYFERLEVLERKGLIGRPTMIDGHSWQTYMICLHGTVSRDQLIQSISYSGVEVNLGAQSLSNIGIYGPNYSSNENGALLYGRGLALPLYEQLDNADLSFICSVLEKAMETAKYA